MRTRRSRKWKRTDRMRILGTLACCVVLVSAVHGAQQEDKSKQKKQTQSAQHTAKPTTGNPAAGAGANKRMPTATSGGQKPGTGPVSVHQSQNANQKRKSQTSTA